MQQRFKGIAIVISILLGSLVAPIFTSQPAQAAGFRSTYGTDFWLTFDRQHADPPSAAKIFVAAASTASLTITWADSTTASYSVNAGAVLTIDALPKWASNNSADGTATTGIHLVADAAVTVYLLNNITSTTDAAIAYPTPFLGTRYRITVAPNELNGLDNTRFSVLATTDSTVITVSPSVAFGSRTAPYQITLNAGQAYTAESTNNIIGTLIESNFPVQVTGSNRCANLGRQACDHLFEFMTPTDTWGKNFIVAGAPNTQLLGDRYVVMSDEAGTDVWVNGNLTSLTNGGEYLLFTGSTADSSGRGDVISSSKPVLVMQFIDGGTYGSPSTTGDPAMVVIPPVAQFLNDAIFTTPATGFTQNSVTIVAKTSEVGSVTLDGTAIASSDFKELTGTSYSIARIFIALGTHRVRSTTGVGVFSYGYNPADSYAYSAGSGLVNLVTYPGGVEEVGYVNVEQITGDDNQTTASPVVQSAAPVPSAKPMSIKFTDVTPRYAKMGERVTFTGKHLDEVFTAAIDSLQISLESQSSQSLVILIPTSLSLGSKDVVFETSEGRITFQNAFILLGSSKFSITVKLSKIKQNRETQLSDLAYASTLIPSWAGGLRCVTNAQANRTQEILDFCQELPKLNPQLARSSQIVLPATTRGSYLRLEFFR